MTPRYAVETIPAADRDLRKLRQQSRDVVRAVTDAIDGLEHDPRPPGCRHLTLPRHSGRFFRIRVGDYRIVYSIDDRNRVVVVIIVDNRIDVYNLLRRRI